MSAAEKWPFQVEPVAVPTLGRSAATAPVSLVGLRAGLAEGAAQAIYLRPNDVDPAAAELEALLSASERARLERFADRPAALRYLFGRSLLRSVLGVLLGLRADMVPLGEGPHGKPVLEMKPRENIAFNLSHSGDLAVLAIASAPSVGVDLELVRPLADGNRLARRILTKDEAERYRRLPAAERGTSLLAAWVRKEAVLKALGIGISGSPSSIETGLDPSAGPLEVRFRGDDAPTGTWWVRLLPLPLGYLGAIALDRNFRNLLSWQAWQAGD